MVKKMVTKLKSNDDVSNLNYFDRLNKLLFGLARLEQTVDDNTKETIYTAKVLKVIDSPVSFPKNIFDDTKIQPKYTFYARIIGEDSPDENLPDPCVLYDVKDPKKAEQSQTKAISMHKMYTTTDKNLTKPQPGSLVRVKLPNLSEGSGIGTYYGLLADDSLPPPVKSPKDSVEAKQNGLAKKIPIEEAKATPFQHQTFRPFSPECKSLFMEAAELASKHETKRGFRFATAYSYLAPGIPSEWGDYNNPEGKALHNILKKESQGRVGQLNYTFRKAVAKRDGYSGGKMPNSDWYGEKYAGTWQTIISKLRRGKVFLGVSSSASGLGQLLISNVRKFYPSGLAGIGNPIEEAAGMLLYIKSRYGTPTEAWAQYGGCSPDGKYSNKHIPKSKRGKPCKDPYDPVRKPGIANTPRPNSPNKKGHDHEGY